MIITCILIAIAFQFMANVLVDLLYFQMQMSHLLPPPEDSVRIQLLKLMIGFAFGLPFITFIAKNSMI